MINATLRQLGVRRRKSSNQLRTTFTTAGGPPDSTTSSFSGTPDSKITIETVTMPLTLRRLTFVFGAGLLF